MKRRLFRNIEPTFFAGLLDDPLLLVRIRPLMASCLFDCGRVHHLAKRVLKSVSALFISHAHMDHFMGIDTFIRANHISPRVFDIFGPPGIAHKLAGKLAGYDWNLAEPEWGTFRAHEIHPDRILTANFPGPEGFPCRFAEETPRAGHTIYHNQYLEIKAELCDHGIPALIFRASERPAFLVDEAKIEREGLVRGDWLRELKGRFYAGTMAQGDITVLRRREGKVAEEPVEDVAALYETIRREDEPAGIGYVTDIGAGEENLAKVETLLKGVTLLVCECAFLAGEREKALVSSHFCTSDLNLLMDRLRPRFVLPMHFSRSYSGKTSLLYEQLEMPQGVTLLRLPEHLTPRPLLTGEVPKLFAG
ncbi:MAG TPA: MBL fold metallo-hydrolase [Geobacteraceae bacterium]|nr:MBL fold metallo-hydrolase [Geobacteraceae bacterium]